MSGVCVRCGGGSMSGETSYWGGIIMEPQRWNVTPQFTDATNRLNGWHLTDHARERMGDRGITFDQVVAVLRHPGTNVPNPKTPGTRQYIRDGVNLIVNEATRTVLTVQVQGASHADWESHQAPQSQEPLREPVAPEPAPVPHRRLKRRPTPLQAPVTSTRVQSALWQECLRRVGGDVRRLRVLGSGEVLIVNRPR